MSAPMQAKDIPDVDVLRAVVTLGRNNPSLWAYTWDITRAFSAMPRKVVVAKAEGTRAARAVLWMRVRMSRRLDADVEREGPPPTVGQPLAEPLADDTGGGVRRRAAR